MPNVQAIYGDRVQFVANMYDALNGADKLAIMTEWSEFPQPRLRTDAKPAQEAVIFDGRNVYDLEQMKAHGFHYISIGRPKVKGKKLAD